MVVAAEIVKYLPGPSPTPVPPVTAKDLELHDRLELKDIVTSRIRFGHGSITNANA